MSCFALHFGQLRPHFVRAVMAVMAIGLMHAPAAVSGPFNGGVVTLLTPTSAGSSFDVAARALAEPLSKAWGVPVIVDNRPGASTQIANAAGARAAPDGRTILMVITPTIQARYLYPNAESDPLTRFVPVSQLFDSRLWFAVHEDVPAIDMQTFVQAARAPGVELAYASPGLGSTPHLNTVQLIQQANINMLHVPYRGISPAVVDLAAGRVQSLFASYSDLLPQEQAGTIRVLASTGPSRSILTPHIPTMTEQGFPGLEFIGFGGFVVPVGTPDPLVQQIAADMAQAMRDASVRERFVNLGLEPVDGGDPAAFGRLMQEQAVYWGNLIKDSGIKIE